MKPGTIVQHYKNKRNYKIISNAKHTETREDMIIYQAQYDDPELGKRPWFVRPKKMFEETVEYEGKNIPRFKIIQEPKKPEATEKKSQGLRTATQENSYKKQ